ncbi:2-phospho-L-lactate guanylyltransferase [Microbacterium sp. P03]|uniref:2-phospho-L-lactate guanylyltransferase n=1 Tax=Microbacterium sp. P03 TaxID=3366946 RepID=UPI0037462888
MTGVSWAVVIPVKPADRGKSRLRVDGLDEIGRITLARAIALDTIAAAAACAEVAQVLVVTEDASLPLLAADIPGLRFVAEGDARGIDEAVAAGAAAAGERMPRAALLGDLPALRSEDLGAALVAASAVDHGVVADAEGTGSTLVTARPGVPWTSAFGQDSFARHVKLGCVPLQVPDASTLRRDVDTADQLDEAALTGLGERTARALGGARRAV